MLQVQVLQSRRPRRHVKIEEEDALMKVLIDERLFIFEMLPAGQQLL